MFQHVRLDGVPGEVHEIQKLLSLSFYFLSMKGYRWNQQGGNGHGWESHETRCRVLKSLPVDLQKMGVIPSAMEWQQEQFAVREVHLSLLTKGLRYRSFPWTWSSSSVSKLKNLGVQNILLSHDAPAAQCQSWNRPFPGTSQVSSVQVCWVIPSHRHTDVHIFLIFLGYIPKGRNTEFH